MGDKTGIEWTDATWNPLVGCSIVSPGCTHCYAMGEAARQIRCAEGLKRETHYAGTIEMVKGRAVWTGKVNLAPEHILTAPLRRKKPTRYFVNSMSDLFHDDVPDEWIDSIFAVMALCPQHTFQVLTKRSARMKAYMTRQWPDYVGSGSATKQVGTFHYAADCATGHARTLQKRYQDRYRHIERVWVPGEYGRFNWPLPNVWLGVSAERQQEADERIPYLLATPAAVRFVSAEPLLGLIDFSNLPSVSGVGRHLDALSNAGAADSDAPGRIDWIIVGGESGPDARPMHPDWARSIRDQCQDAGVAFFFKQWGEWQNGSDIRSTETIVFLDGGTCEWTMEAAEKEAQLRGWSDRRPVAMSKVGKNAAGRYLDGVIWDDWPAREKADA